MTPIVISEHMTLTEELNVLTGTMDIVNSLTMMLYESLEGVELYTYEQLESFSLKDLTGEKGNILEKPEARVPIWRQRHLVSEIMTMYPGKMLTISTWSPLIINTVKPDNLWVVYSLTEIYHPSRSYGLSADQVLREILGADSEYAPEVAKAIDEIDLEIVGRHYEHAEELIDALDKETNGAPIVHGLRTHLYMVR